VTAQQMKAAGTDVQGMISNDIVGSSTADDGTRYKHLVRLFSEGVPTSETAQQTSIRQSIGGENDGPSRQLGRFIREVSDNRATGMDVRTIYRRDRYLRGSDHVSFVQQGYPAVRLTEEAENFAHEHQDVRVENGVQFGDLIEFCDFRLHRGSGTGQPGDLLVPGQRTRHAQERAHRHDPAHQRLDAALGR
jgi:hypothetical protein